MIVARSMLSLTSVRLVEISRPAFAGWLRYVIVLCCAQIFSLPVAFAEQVPIAMSVDRLACKLQTEKYLCDLPADASDAVSQKYGSGCAFFREGEGPLGNRVFDWCDNVLSGGYAKVCESNPEDRLGCGLVNSDMEIVIPLVYDELRFVEGVPLVAVNYLNSWGFFSLSHERLLFTPRFSFVSDFRDGLAYVIDATEELNESAWIIDDLGLRVASVDHNIIVRGYFSDGLIPASLNLQWGYLNKNGHWAIPPQFYAAEPFKNGYAAVKFASETENWALIDTDGEGRVFFEGSSHRLRLLRDNRAELSIGCGSIPYSAGGTNSTNKLLAISSEADNNQCFRICFDPSAGIPESICTAEVQAGS